MGTRKITANDRSVTGNLVSTKQESLVDFESSLERDYFTILEFDRSVKSYTEQPLAIEYVCEKGVKRIYTPDVLIEFVDEKQQQWLCEIKYRADFRENFSKYKAKFRASKEYCKNRNWKFVLIDESIRGNYLYNAKFLLRYGKMEYDRLQEVEVIRVLKKIRKNGFFTPTEFRDNFGESFDVKITGLAVFWRMASRHEILFDHHRKISMNTEMWLNDNYFEND